MFPKYLLTVRATVEAGHEDEFNRWYDEEHVPDALRMFPGCIGAARYRVTEGDGSHQYMATYAFESEAALEGLMASDGLREMIRRYDAAIGSFSTRARTTYVRVLEMDRSAL